MENAVLPLEESALQEHHFLHTLLDHLPDRIYFKDARSRFVLISRAMQQLFRLEQVTDAYGRSDFDFFDHDHARQAFEDEQQVMRSGRPVLGKIEKEVLPDGRTFWVSTTKVPLYDARGRIAGTFGMSRDITELRTVQQALEYERNLLRSLINSLPDHIYVKDLQGRFIVANEALCRFLRADSPAEVLGRTDADFFDPGAAAFFRGEEQSILEGGHPLVNREACTSRDGTQRWVLTTKVPLHDGAGAIIGTVGINRDVSDRKQAQEQLQQNNLELLRREGELTRALADLQLSHQQLRQTQLQLVQAAKMESIGRLAAGVAHEVKNPLATIQMAIDYLLQQDDAGRLKDLPALLKRMRGAVGRATRVIGGLLDYAAPGRLDTVPADVNRILEASLELVDHAMRAGHMAGVLHLADGLPSLQADINKLEQVFVNLFMNAIQAMAPGGQLTVRTRLADPPALPSDAPGSQGAIIVEVADNGPGIPEHRLSRVFDPFFTTKPPGHGTGLGLTVSKTIVELHGGSIDIRNRREGGLLVTLSFPLKGADHGPHTRPAGG